MTAPRLPTYILAIDHEGRVFAREVPPGKSAAVCAETAAASGRFREVLAAHAFTRIRPQGVS